MGIIAGDGCNLQNTLEKVLEGLLLRKTRQHARRISKVLGCFEDFYSLHFVYQSFIVLKKIFNRICLLSRHFCGEIASFPPFHLELRVSSRAPNFVCSFLKNERLADRIMHILKAFCHVQSSRRSLIRYSELVCCR